MYTFLDFFAGGGMARLGLGNGWECLFANDIDEAKARIYKSFFQDSNPSHYSTKDVAKLHISELPGTPDLVWASFPCQDLSLAGAGRGLQAKRSGTFWSFWKLIQQLGSEGRSPTLIVLENVYGALTSHGGRDFAAIGDAFAAEGYKFGALVIDAVHFVPQSRARLFVVGVKGTSKIPEELTWDHANRLWAPPALERAYQSQSDKVGDAWTWWDLPKPPDRVQGFSDLIQDDPQGVRWHSPVETSRLLDLMSPLNKGKVEAARRAGGLQVGGVYKRTRNGTQRAEVRFDNISGCLRTPAGGSSRQTILFVESQKPIRSRLLSTREAARLMGLPDNYPLPIRYNEAYHLIGDGVVIPVVEHLSTHLLKPLLRNNVGDSREVS